MRNRFVRKGLGAGLALLSLAYWGTGGAHPDAAGTRYVAGSGHDEGDCTNNHHPCRTLQFALAHPA